MFDYSFKVLRLAALLAAATLLTTCDQPVTGGALTFYGECISDNADDCVALTPQGSEHSFHVNKDSIIESHHFADAEVVYASYRDESIVSFTLTAEGRTRFAAATKVRIGKVIVMMDEDRLVSAPMVRDHIVGGRGQISNGYSEAEAEGLVARILANSGEVPD